MDIELEIQMTDNNVAELNSRVEELEDQVAILQQQNADILAVLQSYHTALHALAGKQAKTEGGQLVLRIKK